ncbi:MAG: transposase [Patescibacteria group bacterium]
MPTLKQTEKDGSLFFLTIKAINGLPILRNNKYYQVILDSLKYCRENKGWKVYAYTILINHLHIMLKVKDNFSLLETVSDFKSFTAHKILKLLREDKQYDILDEMRMSAYRTKDRDNKIWRKSCWPEILLSKRFIRQKGKYINLNAMEHYVVKDIENYLYTSYHNHYCNHEVVLEIDDIKELF